LALWLPLVAGRDQLCFQRRDGADFKDGWLRTNSLGSDSDGENSVYDYALSDTLVNDDD